MMGNEEILRVIKHHCQWHFGDLKQLQARTDSLLGNPLFLVYAELTTLPVGNEMKPQPMDGKVHLGLESCGTMDVYTRDACKDFQGCQGMWGNELQQRPQQQLQPQPYLLLQG
jgi:hypothetical protein